MNEYIYLCFYSVLCIDQSLTLYRNTSSIHMIELLISGYNAFHFKYLKFQFHGIRVKSIGFPRVTCCIQEVKSEVKEVYLQFPNHTSSAIPM